MERNEMPDQSSDFKSRSTVSLCSMKRDGEKKEKKKARAKGKELRRYGTTLSRHGRILLFSPDLLVPRENTSPLAIPPHPRLE